MNATTTTVGVIAAIHRYPVKSMLGEVLSSATVESRGLTGDRAYALIDAETSRVVSSKRPKRWGRILELCAYIDDTVWVRFPTGDTLSIDDESLPERLGDFFGRLVSIASSPPPDARFDEVWVRELKDGADPYFGRPSQIVDGDEMIAGGASMATNGDFFNSSPVHILTTSALRALSEAAPASNFDVQRFRPNIVIDTPGSGFPETEWGDRILRIGSATFRLTRDVVRCVVTILPQGDLPYDPDILRTVTARNSIDVLSTGTAYPCLGIYAEVLEAGEIHIGDSAQLE